LSSAMRSRSESNTRAAYRRDPGPASDADRRLPSADRATPERRARNAERRAPSRRRQAANAESCRTSPVSSRNAPRLFPFERTFDKTGHHGQLVDFAHAAPALAAGVRGAFHQYGPGLGYLATIRPDGGPRLHPVSPVVTDDGLFCCLLDTPEAPRSRAGRAVCIARVSRRRTPMMRPVFEVELGESPMRRRFGGSPCSPGQPPRCHGQLFALDIDMALLVRRAGRAGRSNGSSLACAARRWTRLAASVHDPSRLSPGR